MPDRRLSVRDRVAAIESLEATARHLNLISAWLGEAGLEVESDAVNDAAKSCLAACWWISRPLSPRLPPSRWTQPQQQPAQAERP